MQQNQRYHLLACILLPCQILAPTLTTMQLDHGQFGCWLRSFMLVYSQAANLKPRWGAGYSRIPSLVGSLCTPSVFSHFQTCSLQPQLMLTSLEAAPSGTTAGCMQLYSLLQSCFLTPGYRLWCAKSVQFLSCSAKRILKPPQLSLNIVESSGHLKWRQLKSVLIIWPGHLSWFMWLWSSSDFCSSHGCLFPLQTKIEH